MFRRLIAWWKAPPFRQRVLAQLADGAEKSAMRIALELSEGWPPFGRVYVELAQMEEKGLVESLLLPGPYMRKLVYKLKENNHAQT